MRSLVICAFLNVASVAAGNGKSDIIGYWLNDSGDAIIKIYANEDGTVSGDIVWLLDSLDIYGQPLRDVMNHKPQQRSRVVCGLTVLHNFKWSSDAWRYGTFYNFKTGNDYQIKMSLDENGNLRLTGYYGILFFLGKTKIWKPVADKSLYGLK